MSADKPQLMGVTEVCDLLGCQKMTLKRWRDSGRFPEPIVVLAKGPIWDRKEVERWQTSRRGS